MEAKYILFFVALVVGVPVGVILCAAVPRLRYAILVVMIWSTSVPDLVGINFQSREFYRAATRGIEVSLMDIGAIILFLHMLLNPHEYRMRWFPPLTLLHLLYVVVAVTSWALGQGSLPVPPEAEGIVRYARFEIGLYPLFEISKIVRGWFVFFVLVNLVRREEDVRAILVGLALTTLYMTYVALTSRYLQGIHRVRGTLGHANSLATYMAMLGTIAFGFMLHFRTLAASSFWGVLTGFSGLCVILTISRGGLMALALGLWLDFAALFRRFFSVKNVTLVILGAFVGMAVLAAAADTLMARFFGEQDAAEDMAYRQLYNDEARLMAREHTFGIGLGNFSAWSWCRYAGLVDPTLPPGTPAHNIWYLTWGELGYPGLILFALIWLRFYVLALPRFFRNDRSLEGSTAVALTAATLVCQLQSALQLGYRQTPIYFLLVLCMGTTVGIAMAERERARGGGQNARLPARP